ncbi:hypothetical protein NHN26_15130 [Rhodovulum tesquicola]|uniref:hypothetical protein n=1 Tax=Rhodovulum tesquicola TaxID=540254 RepID=UPI002096E019|nr:hypothetical protein [Rhodovulum tesquicola]MCO8146553.1 hypothetical protein [Rhodovulum tesquicola]
MSSGRSETGGPCGPSDARAAAIAGLAAGDGLQGAVAGEPAFVHRLDLADAGYYLVPLLREGILVGIAEIEARGCTLAKAGAITAPGTPFLLDPEAARAALPVPSGGAPFLGWQPCRESWDSFLPFWVFDTAEGRFHVDQSGQVHRQLGTGARGG